MERALKSFFWIAFASFLAASIPHIAYFFRAFEPSGAGAPGTWDTAYWIVSYAIAVSIDVTTFLLSYTVAKMHRQKKPGGLIFSVWLFIIGLAALSWYINFQYAYHFINTAMLSSTPITLPMIGYTLPDINPLIASCFQVLAIAYTWIADKINADEKPKSLDELAKEANELEQRQVYEQRIASVKQERIGAKTTGATSTVLGFIGAGKTVLKETFKRDEKQEQNSEQNAAPTPVSEPINSEQNAHIETDKAPDSIPALDETTPVSFPDTGGQNVGKTEGNTNELNPVFNPILDAENEPDTGKLPAINGIETIAAWRSDGRKTATFEEVSEAVNKSVKVLKRRVEKGVLKVAPRNPDLLLIETVLTWLNSEQNGSKTNSIPALKIVQKQEQSA